ESIDRAQDLYSKAAANAEGDPVFEPEALFGVAICEETKAITNRSKLKSAKDAYERLVNHETYKDSAYGKLAKEGLDILKDAKKAAVLAEFYQTRDERLGIQARIPRGGLLDLPKLGAPLFPKDKGPELQPPVE